MLSIEGKIVSKHCNTTKTQGRTPLYGLHGDVRRWTGYGFWSLCPKQGM